MRKGVGLICVYVENQCRIFNILIYWWMWWFIPLPAPSPSSTSPSLSIIWPVVLTEGEPASILSVGSFTGSLRPSVRPFVWTLWSSSQYWGLVKVHSRVSWLAEGGKGGCDGQQVFTYRASSVSSSSPTSHLHLYCCNTGESGSVRTSPLSHILHVCFSSVICLIKCHPHWHV